MNATVCFRITRDKMIEPLLVADPSFGPRWTDFLAEWSDEKDPPLYLALGSLAEHLLDRLQAGRTENFEATFAVVERWHTEGDHYVSEAATVGLLESLQNLSELRGIANVELWLGPESKRWWDKLDRFWKGDANALSSDS